MNLNRTNEKHKRFIYVFSCHHAIFVENVIANCYVATRNIEGWCDIKRARKKTICQISSLVSTASIIRREAAERRGSIGENKLSAFFPTLRFFSAGSKEGCPICFLPMPAIIICCISLLPATITSVPIYDFAQANVELAGKSTEEYYPCCGKRLCRGCLDSFHKSGMIGTCPFCNARTRGKTHGDRIGLMTRVEANDDGATYGQLGLQQDLAKAMELWTQAAKLGCSQAHYHLGNEYRQRGDSKKAKFHYKAAAMAGYKTARFNLGCMEYLSGNVERYLNHLRITALGGSFSDESCLIYML